MKPKPIRFRAFDVRPLLQRGAEPFPEIRKRVDELKPDEGLQVTAPFLPSPLIEKLKSEGFNTTIDHQSDGSWIVRFWRDLGTEASPQ